jgi:hypothetical protein
MANHYIAMLVYLPSKGFQVRYVMFVLLLQKRSQLCEGIYGIRYSYQSTEGLLTSRIICGYFKTISRLYRSRVNSRTFLIINQLDALISEIYFGNETLHVSDSFSVHHQELFTVHSAVVYVIQVCRELSSGIRDPTR